MDWLRMRAWQALWTVLVYAGGETAPFLEGVEQRFLRAETIYTMKRRSPISFRRSVLNRFGCCGV